MDDTSTIIFVTMIAIGLISVYFAFRIMAKGRKKETEAASVVAASLGLSLLEPEEAMRRSYEESGQLGLLERFEKLPAPILNFLRTNAPWRIEGKRDGLPVAIYSETRSSGRSSTTYIVVRVGYRKPLAFDLHVARESQLTKLGKAFFGLQDIEIGDAELDPLIRIKAKEGEAVRLLFSRKEVKAAIIAALESVPDLRIESAWTGWERVGRIADPAVLVPVLDALVPLAKALDGSSRDSHF